MHQFSCCSPDASGAGKNPRALPGFKLFNVCLLGAKVETLPSIHAICPTECLWNKRMQKEPANTSKYWKKTCNPVGWPTTMKREREREKESSEKVYDGQTGGTWCLNQRHAIIFDSSACIQHVCSVCLFVAFPVCVGLAEHVNMNRLSTCAVRGEFFTAECPFKSKLRLSSARKGHSDLYTLYRNPGKGAIVAQACAGGQPQKQGAKPACTSETEKKRRDTPRPCVSLCVWGSQRLIWTNDKHISVIGRRDNICLQKIIMIITKCSKYLQYDYDTVEKNDVFWTATCATISLKRRSAPEIAAEICPSASAHCILQWSWQGQLN